MEGHWDDSLRFVLDASFVLRNRLGIFCFQKVIFKFASFNVGCHEVYSIVVGDTNNCEHNICQLIGNVIVG